MKNHIFSIGLLAALAISCSTHEMDFKDTNVFEEFYASIENTETPNTKVYATEELYLRWNADDRITIFNKYTYNQEYRFTGGTGDNSGSFKRVDNGDFVTGNSLDNIYAIYPYLESTRISDTGVITVTLPAEQDYAENTMGLGANTMVSATADNQLLFKNVGGYLMLKLYGDDVTVSSISLKGNNGERIAGKATVSMPINGIPTVAVSESAGQEITLVCETPVKIGSTAETATTFWIVVPPTVFSKGFTLTVKDNKNGVFEKATSKSFEVGRNKLARMSALEVSLEYPDPSDEAIVFADSKLKERLVAKFDTNGDGELSYKEAAAVTSIEGAVTIKTITSFDEFQYFTSVKVIPDYFFNDWTKLTSITLPPNLVKIGYGSFLNCNHLQAISIPSSVSIIDGYAFMDCKEITSIIIPGDIGSHAFSGCSKLSDVQFTNDVKTIESDAFLDCINLTSINIPRSVTEISIYSPFKRCSSLSSITVDSENQKYDSRENCNAIIKKGSNTLILGCKNTIIPAGVKEIGASAFDGCSQLTSLSIPEGVTYVGNLAFQKCSGLTAVQLPESLTGIGYSAFVDCSNLKTINIPEGLTTIESSTFAGCSSLISIEIPESISMISGGAFQSCSSLISISIPESVTSIWSSAFSGCTSLSSIIVNAEIPPTGGDRMFYQTNNCPIYVPAGSVDAYKTAQYWSDYADRIQAIPLPKNEIWYTSTDGEIVSPNNPDAFGSNIISNSIKNGIGIISFDGDVDNLGNHAFAYCSNLKSIILPNSVLSIGQNAFFRCSNLISIILPESATRIGTSAFEECISLTSILVPDSVLTIEAFAFRGCSNLTSVSLPRNITAINSYTFQNCSSLANIVLPESITFIGDYAFRNCSKLTTINLPKITRINEGVFAGCISITSISIPDCVLEIKMSAFSDCRSLISITLPKSIQGIRQGAFWGCYSLTSITCLAVNPPSGGSDMFYDTNNCTIYVPAESVEVYVSRPYWAEYSNRIKPIQE